MEGLCNSCVHCEQIADNLYLCEERCFYFSEKPTNSNGCALWVDDPRKRNPYDGFI